MARSSGKRTFGEVESRRNSRSGKITGWRARYWGPDLDRHSLKFSDRTAAEAWLAEEQKLIDRGEWTPPKLRNVVVERLTLSEWAAEHIASLDLAPGTLRNYNDVLHRFVDPVLGKKYLDEITVHDVAVWHARLKADLRAEAQRTKRKNGDGSGQAAQAYKIVSGFFKGAVVRGLIDHSPARVVGGGRYRRRRAPVLLTPDEEKRLAQALPENLRALADLLAWSGLRIAEASALRRTWRR